MKKPVILWNIDELICFFTNEKIPEGPIILDNCTKIINPTLFISSGLATIEKHNGNEIYKPYLDRLIQLKKLLTNE